jgi:ABC-type sugar transport system permease subunit
LIPTTYPAFGSSRSSTGGRPPLDGATAASMKMPRFTQVYLMTQGGPYNSTQVLFTYAYQQAFSNFEFSYAAALASMLAVVVLVLSVAEVRVLRGDPAERRGGVR